MAASDAIQPQQFRQLQMLMPLTEVVDKVHKIDSPSYSDRSSTPSEQWAEVRTKKRSKTIGAAIHRGEGLPPMRIQYSPSDDIEPELWDGHHRLREYEKAKHTEVPVSQHFDPRDAGPIPGEGYRAVEGQDPYKNSRRR